MPDIQNAASPLKISPFFMFSNDTRHYTGFESPSCFVKTEMGEVEGRIENTETETEAETAEGAKPVNAYTLYFLSIMLSRKRKGW